MIIQSLQKLTATGEQLYAKICTVHRVDKVNKCCDVIPVDGSAELFEVPFHPSEVDQGLCLYPTKGSLVLVVFINKHHACICGMSELEMMQLKIGQVELSIDREGFLLKKEKGSKIETLATLMEDLLKEIKGMSYTSPSGACTLMPDSLLKLNEIQARFKSLLKDV